MKVLLIFIFGVVCAVSSYPVESEKNGFTPQFRYRIDHNDGDDNEQGYQKKLSDEGSKGYKHYDSFHKKEGDKYGYETHSSFGDGHRDETEVNAESGKYDEGSDKGQDAHNEETKHYEVIEEIDENDNANYSEGDSYEQDGSGNYSSDDGEDNGQYTHEEANSEHDNYEDYSDGEGDKSDFVLYDGDEADY